ncbi:hypothetical protein IWX90DRAFT_46807 [Phyllosticta citrichinensis]|uniref:Uncharacterized protein n=1 Tax=Phyllosticta citrichinensis TaxID=1130410 RepID=A0ABR1XHZ4_9PEZI
MTMRVLQFLFFVALLVVGCVAAGKVDCRVVNCDVNGNPICTPHECNTKCSNDDICKKVCVNPATKALVGQCITMENNVKGCFCSCTSDDQCGGLNGVCANLVYNDKDPKVNKAFQKYVDKRTCIVKTKPKQFDNADSGCLCEVRETFKWDLGFCEESY